MHDQIRRQIRTVETWPHRAGKRELLNHLRGRTITRAQAMKAKCYECCGGEGGICTVRACPLHQYSQYAEKGQQEESEIEN